MNEFDASLSIGNCFGLQRSHEEVKEAVRVVSGNTNAPLVYDSFAFVATDMRKHFETKPVEFTDELLIGTTTVSCFTQDNELVGGMLVSLPWVETDRTETEAFFNSYQDKFGNELVSTFENRPSFNATETFEIGIEDIGLKELDVEVIDTGSTEVGGKEIATFGFVSEETINILYLVSDGQVNSIDKFRSIVRQLDTLTVFESPKSSTHVTGSVWVPCNRILDSTQFQSYMESEYALSSGTHLNIGNIDSPQLYVDSELQFTFSKQFGGKYTVEVIGSRNANEIERQARSASKSVTSIETESLSTIKSGSIGERMRGGEVFIGQTYVDWRCGCESEVCPTVVIVQTDGEITPQELESIDSILQDVEGREGMEVTIGDVTVTGFAS